MGQLYMLRHQKTALGKIDVISNEALRIATGTLELSKSTPIEALYNVVEETTPSERIDYLAIRYFLKVRESNSNPAC